MPTIWISMVYLIIAMAFNTHTGITRNRHYASLFLFGIHRQHHQSIAAAGVILPAIHTHQHNMALIAGNLQPRIRNSVAHAAKLTHNHPNNSYQYKNSNNNHTLVAAACTFSAHIINLHRLKKYNKSPIKQLYHIEAPHVDCI